MLDLAIRKHTKEDVPLILSSWCKSYYDAPHVAWVPQGTFMRLYHDYVEHLLDTHGISIAIACDPQDETQIFGWIACSVYGSTIIHYAYTKHLFRRVGVCRRLLEHAFGGVPKLLVVSHWTRACVWNANVLIYHPHEFFTSAAIDWMKDRHFQTKHTIT